MDNLNNIRVCICEHTEKPVVQGKFGNEWVCLHGDTEQEDVELINKFNDGRI
jgi:hypothetical protein